MNMTKAVFALQALPSSQLRNLEDEQKLIDEDNILHLKKSRILITIS